MGRDGEMTFRRYILTALSSLMLAGMPGEAAAQSDDFGLWLSAGAEKKIDKKWSVGVEGEFRTRDDCGEVARWSIGIDGEYKIADWLKASAGYTLLYDNNNDKVTYHSDGTENNWRPSYWGIRHRFNVSLTGKVRLGDFSVSLRERWQYTYRPEKTTDRYDYDNEKWEETQVRGKGRNVLRSKLKIDYDIPKSSLTPYADVELFNAWSLQKTRYTIGTDWKLTKKHVVGIYYRYQDVNNDKDDDDPSSHIIGVEYKFKF